MSKPLKYTLMFFEIDNTTCLVSSNNVQWLEYGRIGYIKEGKELVRGDVLKMAGKL